MPFNFFFANLEVSEPDLVVENVERKYVVNKWLALRMTLRSAKNLLVIYMSKYPPIRKTDRDRILVSKFLSLVGSEECYRTEHRMTRTAVIPSSSYR